MLFPGWLLLPSLVLQNPNAPMSTLVQSYPFGDQLSLEVTPDDSLAFIGEGAAITILDLNAAPSSPKLDQVLIPNCQLLSLRYYHHAPTDQDWLFIAGGTHGVWKLELCSGLFPTPPNNPVACGSSWWDPPSPQSPSLSQIELVHGTGNFQFERKRCVAVAVLDAPTGFNGPVLFALFAASSFTTDIVTPTGTLPPHSDIGPTELRAYLYPWTSSTLLVSKTSPRTTPSRIIR